MAAPIVAMSHVFIRSVPDAAYVAVYSFGPAIMTFSTVLVAFYWSGLIFYQKKEQLWNIKLFVGLLAFFLVGHVQKCNSPGTNQIVLGNVATVYYVWNILPLSHANNSRHHRHCSGKF